MPDRWRCRYPLLYTEGRGSSKRDGSYTGLRREPQIALPTGRAGRQSWYNPRTRGLDK
jgi:hypothetical protein